MNKKIAYSFDEYLENYFLRQCAEKRKATLTPTELGRIILEEASDEARKISKINAYQRLYSTAMNVIERRLKEMNAGIDAKEFLEMPLCEQKRYLKEKCWRYVNVIGYERWMSHEAIDGRFMQALRY